MEAKELNRLIANAELRNPKTFNASRERYVVEISFEAGKKEVNSKLYEALKEAQLYTKSNDRVHFKVTQALAQVDK